MKITTTATLLVLTLIIVPFLSFFTGSLPDMESRLVLSKLMAVMLASALLCFLIGEITANNSQVDKIWSILPILYVWIVYFSAEHNIRLMIMAMLVSLWGIRLTYNFSLKGAYQIKFWQGEEDYRWKILKNRAEFQPRWKWTLFNLFFISGYQNGLILLFTLPALVCFQYRGNPLNYIDFLAILFMLFFIITESIADHQQWVFQNKKRALNVQEESIKQDKQNGFLDSGLWAYSRHPNYFSEQMIWLSFYLFSVAASGHWINWSVIGIILLMLLFQGSANFSEGISAEKYPDYKLYQQQVNKFIPWKRSK